MINVVPTQSISLIEAFDAMRYFLEAYWERGGKSSDELAILLGSLNRDEVTLAPPLDEAMWDDWLSAVASTVAKRS